MFSNYFKITIRQFLRNKGYSFLNVLGLSIGLAVSILGFLYVLNETSYDRFHKNSERIHRVVVDAAIGAAKMNMAVSPAVYAPTMYHDFPEIDKITRIYNNKDFEFEYEGKKFIEKEVFQVDSTFFDIFTFPVIQGKTSNLLNEPNCAVITKTIAIKYFGDRDPINKILSDGANNFKIIAVIEDIPKHSHFHFKIALSLISFDGYYNNPSWMESSVKTYVMFRNDTDHKLFENKLPDFINRYLYNSDRYKKLFAKEQNHYKLQLQPLTSIHLSSDLFGEFEVNGKKEYVNIFLTLSIFILVVACINFINLSTAKAEKRAKEIGVKKVVGASKISLIKQFIGESIITSFVALILALMFVELILVSLPNLVGIKMQMPYLSNIYFIPTLILLGLIVGVVSGIYPAMVLSAFRPIIALKAKNKGRKGSNLFRNVLVVFQFVISVILIIGAFVISSQIDLLLKGDLGFKKERVIIINNANLLGESISAIKNEINTLPFVSKVAHANRMPGESFNSRICRIEGESDSFSIDIFFSDEDLKEVLEFQILKGRYFLKDYGTDSLAIVINEEAEKAIGGENVLGRKITLNGRLYQNVIGVVKNFHYETKHQKVKPLAIRNINKPGGSRTQYLSVRIKSDDDAYMISELNQIWNKYSSKIPFDYTFLDKRYDAMYANEIYMKKLFLGFSVLSVFIACLGLLGMVSFITQHRTKEIGIRRTFGASVSKVIILLSTGFAKWIIMANIIAWPLAWFIFDRWLSQFSYRTEINWWYFLVAAVTSLFIAMTTISYNTFKVAKSNPIEALKYE